MGFNSAGSPTRNATNFSLQRSGASLINHRPLRQGAIPTTLYDSYLPLIDGKLPRFTSINVESKRTSVIAALIGKLLQHPSSLVIPELSIHLRRDAQENPKYQPRSPEEFVTEYESIDPQVFATLLSSLSILRISGLAIDWDEVSFSKKLVELRLQSVIFGDQSETAGFLSVLQSASELQYLKIISVVTLLDLDEVVPSGAPDITISLPKLQSLLLQDLDYITLWIFSSSIVPGPHRTKLCLTSKSKRVYESGEEPLQDTEAITDFYYALLGSPTVDTLILHGGFQGTMWLNDDALRRILRSFPTLKTLKISAWNSKSQSLKR